MGNTTLDLSTLPGESAITRDGFHLQFFPDRGFVAVAKRNLRSESMVRVDVRAVDGTLELRARRLASFVVWIPLLVLVFALRGVAVRDVTVLIVCACGFFASFFRQEEEAREGVAAVASELKARLAALDQSRRQVQDAVSVPAN
jgi:hypothetical protein